MLKRGALERKVLRVLGVIGEMLSTREIADGCKRTPQNVRATLQALEAKGKVRKMPGENGIAYWQSTATPEKRPIVTHDTGFINRVKIAPIKPSDIEKLPLLNDAITSALEREWEAVAARIEEATAKRDTWQLQIDRMTAERVGLESVIQRRKAKTLE